MTISVLMSFYSKDDPSRLEAALSSIWDEQSLTPDEVVLIQDGNVSKELAQVANVFAAQKGDAVKVITLPENRGLAGALNVGISICKSEYIARMDADDLSLPDRFQLQSDFMDNNPSVAVVGGALTEVDPAGNFLRTVHYPLCQDEVLASVHYRSPLAHPTVFFRKAIFDDGFRYNESLRFSQDLDLWFRLLSTGYEIGNLPTSIVKFTCGRDFFSRRNRKRAWLEFKIYTSGIYSIYGWSWRLVPPIFRFCFRLMPSAVARYFYNSRFREGFKF